MGLWRPWEENETDRKWWRFFFLIVAVRSGGVDSVRRRDERHSLVSRQFLPQFAVERCPLADGRHARLSALHFLLPAANVRRRVVAQHFRPRLGHRKTRSLLGHFDQLRMDFRSIGFQFNRRTRPQVHGLEQRTQQSSWTTGTRCPKFDRPDVKQISLLVFLFSFLWIVDGLKIVRTMDFILPQSPYKKRLVPCVPRVIIIFWIHLKYYLFKLRHFLKEKRKTNQCHVVFVDVVYVGNVFECACVCLVCKVLISFSALCPLCLAQRRIPLTLVREWRKAISLSFYS